ncbi:flagellar hook-length control protein FliK [Hydrogenophaga sp.]|uniref:flagellar hook-length control protein FliK n=1 Tax=Hydrogenophaga sp. TaxID=1904254 RepID=UPI00271D8F53|nr:flagellar hook-length control protein FliK [Hydrogenophaga sp.]MDO9438571.1 flagellar hook-length control protein FliK [Hydrogenophaga sp.]
MTTTTAPSQSAPKPVEAAHKPSQSPARAEGDKSTDMPADLFAAMLAMLSDGQPAPVATEDPLTGTDKDTDATSDANPLTAMLAWMASAQAAAGSDTRARSTDKAENARIGAQDASTTGVDGARQEGIDIEGMTRVDEAAPALPNAAAQARAAAASRPAFSPLNTNAPANSVSATLRAQPDAQAISGGGAPAMVWQRGAAPGTDAMQQQLGAQHAQVRSTVALNERFGLAGAPPEFNTAAPSPREFAGVGGSAAVSGAVASSDTGVAGLVGAGSANEAGSGNGERGSDTQTSDGQPHHHAEAGSETEGPTVSHWGTQHMRHASLRVGGEGGADAIDIQLQVKGQEVQVAFQTDNAEARAQLRENAGASLADLMQRSGIQLGNVSVGSQGQPSGGHAQSDAGARTASIGRAGATAEATAGRPLQQQPLRSDGSRPLDVFA